MSTASWTNAAQGDRMTDQDGDASNETRTVRRARRREPLGVARVRSPVFNQRDGVWLARYVDLVGKERQAGRFARKRDAASASQQAVDTLNLRRSRSQVVPRLDDYLEHEWTQTFP